MEKEIAEKAQTKLASATVVCTFFFTGMCYLRHFSRGVLSFFADRQ